MISLIKSYIVNNNNIILYGSSGIGKSLVINCIVQELEIQPKHIYTLNACGDRSVKTIRTSLLSFLKHASSFKKLVLINDVVNMPVGAQHSLCSLMDKYKDVAFVCCTNNHANIIESIQSRCLFLELRNPEQNEITEYLTTILDKEEVVYHEDIFPIIYQYFKSDIRKQLVVLQSSLNERNEINTSTVKDIITSPFEQHVKTILYSIRNDEYRTASMEFNTMFQNGYNHSDVINYLFMHLVYDTQLSEEIRLKYMDIIGQTKISINRGLFSSIQVDKMIVLLCKLHSNDEQKN